MKRIIAIVLGLLVLVAAPAAGETTTPPKEEVVYAHLDGAGTVDRVFVVNAFPDATGDFVDYGTYTEVTNLTNTDKLDRKADHVKIGAENGNFYYQGELADPQLPWTVQISYTLDGREVNRSDLKGANGALEMLVKVRKNQVVDPVFFDHYMLQIQVTLDTKYFSQIEAKDATIASNGTSRVISLTSMPGKASDFLITANAKDAHLGQMQAVGLPFAMAIDLPDASQYTSDLVDLEKAIAAIADGASQLANGVTELDTAAGQLNTGAAGLAGGAQDLDRGFDQLAAGRGDFDAGLRQYVQGVQSFAAGVGALGPGSQQLASGIDQLTAGSGQLATGLGDYATGMDQFSAGLGASAQGSQAITDGLAALGGGLGQLTQSGKYADDNLVGASAQILGALQQMDSQVNADLGGADVGALVTSLQEFSAGLTQFGAALDQMDLAALQTALQGANTQLGLSTDKVEAIAAELSNTDALAANYGIDPAVNTEAGQLLDYMAGKGGELMVAAGELRGVQQVLTALDTQVGQLSGGLTQLRGQLTGVQTGVDQLAAGLEAANLDGLAMLDAGLTQLATQYAGFHQGLVGYVDGVEQTYLAVAGDPARPTENPGLLAGSQQLTGGLNAAAQGGAELASGAHQLAGAASGLHAGLLQTQSGAIQLRDGVGEVVAGANQLGGGGQALIDGHGQLVAGENQFSTGLGEYATGVGTYANGVQQFDHGVTTLAGGANSLAEGTGVLRDETRGMDEQMVTKIEEQMADLLPSDDYQLISFASPLNTGIERVQFVYLVDAQTEPSAEPSQPEPEPEKSIWQRIMDIFR